MNQVENKVAIVTGGGNGIGQAASELLATAGASVVVTDININAANNTVENIKAKGGSALAIKHDVASEEDWQQVIKETLEAFGQVDVLVNNAGMSMSGACTEVSLQDWRKVMSVNLDGVFLGTRLAISSMIERDNAGSIINISSASGLVGGGVVPYSTAKAGVAMLTKSVAIECARKGYNIRANTIYPGAINTAITFTPRNEEEAKNLPSAEQLQNIREQCARHIPMQRFGDPIDIARGHTVSGF